MEIEELQRLGERNEELIRLLGQHCRNARVEKSPHSGQGMVEAMTGLPIDAREIGCPHAANPSMAGMNLEVTAVDFYRRNCVDCPHRQPVGIPNLKTYVEEVDRAAAAEREREERETEARIVRRNERGARRAEVVRAEPEATREWIGLIDGIDTEKPDARAEQFLDIARAGPELCTSAAALAITETAESVADRRLVTAIDLLQATGRIDDEPSLRAALAGLADTRMAEALPLLARLHSALTPETLKPCLPSIIRLAGPAHHFPGPSPTVELAGLQVAIAVDLPGLLDEMRAMIGSSNTWVRGSAGAAAAELISLEPGTAEILAASLVGALELPGSLSPYSDSPQGQLTAGLEAALVAKPPEVAALYLRRGLELSKDERQVLYRAFDRVIRSRMQTDVPEAAGEIVVESLLEIAGGAHGEDAARWAADSLELAAKYHPKLLSGRAAALIGTIMTAVTSPVETEPGTPAEVQGLVLSGQQALRSGRISELSEALGHLAKYDPDAVAEEILAILDTEDPPGDAAVDFRAELTKILGSLGVHPRLREVVLPRLYTALLSEHQTVRAAGIDAWRELAGTRHFQAPPELEDLTLALLTDPYVVVHLGMVRALRFRFPIPERLILQVTLCLLQLAEIYAQEGQRQDALDGVLDTLWRRSHTLDPRTRLVVRQRVLHLATHMYPHDLARLLGGVEGEERDLREYADRLVQVLSESESFSGDRNDALMRRLRDLPMTAVRERADVILGAGKRHLPRWTVEAAEYLEVLEAAGCWEEATALVREMVAGVPEDTEHAVQRAHVLGLEAQVDLERAVVGGDTNSAEAALRRWHTVSESERAARSARTSPFGLDALDGLDA